MPGQPIKYLSADILTLSGASLWLALVFAALVIDLTLGQYLSRYIPSPETFFRALCKTIASKMDRPSRTLGALRVRGFLAIAILVPACFGAGLFLNSLLLLEPWIASAVAALILSMMLGQRTTHDAAIDVAKNFQTRATTNENDRHLVARQTCAAVTLAYTNKLVVRAIWWCLGGFAFLLPLMLLNSLFDVAEKRRSGEPESPFFTIPAFLHELVVAPFSILASMFFALAHFFIPGTNLSVFKGLNPGATKGPVSRYFPLNVAAIGLGLSLEAAIGEDTGKKKMSDKTIYWIGPDNGRAKAGPEDIRRAWHLSLVGTALFFVAAAMAFSLLMLQIFSG